MNSINEVEVNNNYYSSNNIKQTIINNEPIEKKLNVIIVISNPCLYKRRYQLLKEFVKRFETEESNVNLYIVELIYENQTFAITDSNNKNHLQLETKTPMWHKENMINLGVKYLLPNDWKAFAWIDADIEFENINWALDTLKLLNNTYDIVQLFSHVVDMDKNEKTMNIFTGFGYYYTKKNIYSRNGLSILNYWHPGYAWAMNRTTYEKLGGLFDKGILGSGDDILSLSLIKKCNLINNRGYCDEYNQSILNYQTNAKDLKLGYVPGVIRHYFHGKKVNRKYAERHTILKNYKYNPNEHVTYDAKGILIPTENFSSEFKNEIYNYFLERKEDDE